MNQTVSVVPLYVLLRAHIWSYSLCTLAYRNTAGTPAMLHRKAPCTGGTRGWLYPHRRCQKKVCTLLYLYRGYPQLGLYLYHWYVGSSYPKVLRYVPCVAWVSGRCGMDVV